MAVVLLLGSGSVSAATELPEGPHIATSGSGTATAAPDSVKITLTFSHRAAQAGAAKQVVDAGVNRYLDTLQRFNIGPKDVEASGIDVGEEPDDDSPRRKPAQFMAERSVTVVLGDLARLNELLDAGLADGATDIGSVQFQLRDPAPLREQAKRSAVDNAREEAASNAAAFGASLGPVYSINSHASRQGFGYGTELDRVQVTGRRKSGDQAKPKPGQYLQPEIRVTEQVSAVFELKR